MVPPYLAYYGALSSGNESIALLQEAYDQCRAYREILRDPESNLWKHIVLGTGLQDYTHWGTGTFTCNTAVCLMLKFDVRLRQCMGCCWYAQSAGDYPPLKGIKTIRGTKGEFDKLGRRDCLCDLEASGRCLCCGGSRSYA